MYTPSEIPDLMADRLLRRKPDDLPVDDLLFANLMRQLGPVERKVIATTVIPGIPEDEMLSLMHLKAHQVMRRGYYTPPRKPDGIFFFAWRNMFRDLLRMRERSIRDEGPDILEAMVSAELLTEFEELTGTRTIHDDLVELAYCMLDS